MGSDLWTKNPGLDYKCGSFKVVHGMQVHASRRCIRPHPYSRSKHGPNLRSLGDRNVRVPPQSLEPEYSTQISVVSCYCVNSVGRRLCMNQKYIAICVIVVYDVMFQEL
jgi:hypothetical protein